MFGFDVNTLISDYNRYKILFNKLLLKTNAMELIIHKVTDDKYKKIIDFIEQDKITTNESLLEHIKDVHDERGL